MHIMREDKRQVSKEFFDDLRDGISQKLVSLMALNKTESQRTTT